jgi:hypothetical protein
MFDSFEEYAEIMNIPTSHPYWEAFQMVWRMARSPSFPDSNEDEVKENP